MSSVHGRHEGQEGPGQPPLPRSGFLPDLPAAIANRLSSRRTAFERYRLRGPIGRGGMGEVLQVRDEDLQRDLAMKVLLGSGSGSSDSDSSPGDSVQTRES